MSEDTKRDEAPEGADVLEEAAEALEAEAAEAVAAAEEELLEAAEDFYGDEDPAVQWESAIGDAHRDALESKAWWSLVHKEQMTLLFANILFFAGALSAWSRAVPGSVVDPSKYVHGLDTIRGALIFALALYGFVVIYVNIRFRQTRVLPIFLNALFALWVGLPGFYRMFGSEAWKQAQEHVDNLRQVQSVSILDAWLIPLSAIAPGYWMLTAGGLLVLLVLVRGVLAGASSVKAQQRQAAGSRRRRS